MRYVNCKAEAFTESTQLLDNPYQGFYRIYRYTLSDEAPPVETATPPVSLALLEINLKQYRGGRISEKGLAQLEEILGAWAGAHTKLILRFLYDWDGLAPVTEPESLAVILTHMEQISPIVNRRYDAVYCMQGLFIGNWGEMHHSRFGDSDLLKALAGQLHRLIHPAIFLSVRTPAQWRMLTGYSPKHLPAEGLAGRLGLFNDGILGSQTDLGTYADTQRRGGQGTREEELAFQETMCRRVPNGGEVVYNETLSALESAVRDLRTMHVSYLNADYDSRVLDRWRQTVWTGRDAFRGCDGYTYVQAHLGYRYLIRACRLQGGWRTARVALTLENVGFSGALRPMETALVLRHTGSGACARRAFPTGLEHLSAGQKKSYAVKIPVHGLERGRYEVYFSAIDEISGQPILLANRNAVTEYGYLLGQLER